MKNGGISSGNQPNAGGNARIIITPIHSKQAANWRAAKGTALPSWIQCQKRAYPCYSLGNRLTGHLNFGLTLLQSHFASD
jgi:hypothetical protein